MPSLYGGCYLGWNAMSDPMAISNWVHGTLCANGEKGSLGAKPMVDFVGRFGGKVVKLRHVG